MRIFIALCAVLILLIACGQQTVQQPVPEPQGQQQEQQQQQPLEPDAEPSPLAQGHAVTILGLGGFEPLELTISTGDEVTFKSELAKKDTLVFKLQGKVTMENSPVIEPGASYTKTFTEPGTYEYWAVGFGPKGAKIVVE